MRKPDLSGLYFVGQHKLMERESHSSFDFPVRYKKNMFYDMKKNK